MKVSTEGQTSSQRSNRQNPQERRRVGSEFLCDTRRIMPVSELPFRISFGSERTLQTGSGLCPNAAGGYGGSAEVSRWILRLFCSRGKGAATGRQCLP